MSNVAKTSPELDKLADRLNVLYSQMEKCYVTVCETMGAAREHFDDDDDFWDWVGDATSFSRTSSNQYLQVYRNVLENRGFSEKVKSMPFKSLREIAREDVPKSIQNKVINDFAKADKGKARKPKYEEVKAQVRGALGKPAQKPKPLTIVRKKSFAERLEYADKHDVAGQWLFDLPQDYCPETAGILVKYWKRKYHPDQGGNAYMFALLSEKADQLEVK
jgi:hypothetical protein